MAQLHNGCGHNQAQQLNVVPLLASRCGHAINDPRNPDVDLQVATSNPLHYNQPVKYAEVPLCLLCRWRIINFIANRCGRDMNMLRRVFVTPSEFKCPGVESQITYMHTFDPARTLFTAEEQQEERWRFELINLLVEFEAVFGVPCMINTARRYNPELADIKLASIINSESAGWSAPNNHNAGGLGWPSSNVPVMPNGSYPFRPHPRLQQQYQQSQYSGPQSLSWQRLNGINGGLNRGGPPTPQQRFDLARMAAAQSQQPMMYPAVQNQQQSFLQQMNDQNQRRMWSQQMSTPVQQTFGTAKLLLPNEQTMNDDEEEKSQEQLWAEEAQEIMMGRDAELHLRSPRSREGVVKHVQQLQAATAAKTQQQIDTPSGNSETMKRMSLSQDEEASGLLDSEADFDHGFTLPAGWTAPAEVDPAFQETIDRLVQWNAENQAELEALNSRESTDS